MVANFSYMYLPIYIRGRGGKEAASISLTQQEPAGRPILLALLWFLFKKNAFLNRSKKTQIEQSKQVDNILVYK